MEKIRPDTLKVQRVYLAFAFGALPPSPEIGQGLHTYIN